MGTEKSARKERAVREVRREQRSSKGSPERTGCATSRMIGHLLPVLLLLVTAKWLTGRVQLVHGCQEAGADLLPSLPTAGASLLLPPLPNVWKVLPHK